MAGKGLDEASRNYIAKLIHDGESGEYVRNAITSRVRSSDWDFQKNLAFWDWLRRQGWNDTAEHLAKYVDG